MRPVGEAVLGVVFKDAERCLEFSVPDAEVAVKLRPGKSSFPVTVLFLLVVRQILALSGSAVRQTKKKAAGTAGGDLL